jgi:LacI family gluconate utilization system Gnt-I transcriptional repressor
MFAVQAMTEEFARAGYQVMLGQRGYDHNREEMLVDAVIARRPDGIVLMGALQSEVAKQRLKTTGIPIVETWDMVKSPIDMLVGFSHEDVGAAVAGYLYGKGRRKFALIAAEEPRGAARAKGFTDAARRLGLVNAADGGLPTYTIPAPTRMKHGRLGLRTLMQTHPEIDAIYCASDLVALGALIEAGARGIAVPEQVAIVGFGDLDFAQDAEPPLTTVHIDNTEIGRQAASMIIERIGGRETAAKLVDLGFTVVKRESA